MAVLGVKLRAYPYASELRRELSLRSLGYARQHKLQHRESFAQPPVICYYPSADGLNHGNFLDESYRAILGRDSWRRRLEKVHTQISRSADRRWRELDSCNSSDALLMNIFCNPRVLRSQEVFNLLGLAGPADPCFGVRARVPLANGRFDRTEVDMCLGNLLVEAKLTELDFQSCNAELLQAYRNIDLVFEVDDLPRAEERVLSSQLIRNVLAAYASGNSFCLISDERRPDLKEAWYAIMRNIRIADLRVRCKIVTWQELSVSLPRRVRLFLADKYGIAAGNIEARGLAHSELEFA